MTGIPTPENGVSLEARVDASMRPRLRYRGTHSHPVFTPGVGMTVRTQYHFVDQYDRLWFCDRDWMRIITLIGRY